jgi:FkbM family methyltransferase
MIELGAGWGRWMLCAASAVRRSRRIPFRLVGVEADPAHFRKMRQCFEDNGLTLSDHRLIQAAVNDRAGSVRFSTPGDIPNNYGQEVLRDAPREPWLRRLRQAVRGVRRDPPAPAPESMGVPAITLNGLLAEEPGTVDLIDADIQGAEGLVFEASAELVDRKVKRVFIGTHPYVPGVEDAVRDVFHSLGWENVYDFAGRGTRATPYGDVTFDDGVQVWVNPRLSPA